MPLDEAAPGKKKKRPARKWWASRWLAMLESLGLASRVERGKRYARSHRVLELEIGPGFVVASVQGSRFEPYRVRIRWKKFTERQWQKAIEPLGSQALFAAKLLSGEMPRNIEDALAAAGLSLFPASLRELRAECSCPDVENPCKHIAAVHYVLSDRFDEDPFLLFRLRGRERDDILKELRARRAAEASGRAVVTKQSSSLATSLGRFWEPADGFESIAISVGAPPVNAALWKRLGLPGFWKSHPEVRGALERLYGKVTERAMALAYGGQSPDTSEEADTNHSGM